MCGGVAVEPEEVTELEVERSSETEERHALALSNLDMNNSIISFKDDQGHQTAPGGKRPDLSIQTIFDAESMAPPDTPQMNGDVLEVKLT